MMWQVWGDIRIYRSMVWANAKERSHLLNKYDVEGGMYSSD